MKNKIESRKFFVRDYTNGQNMKSDIVSYAEECKDRYPKCAIRTETIRDDFGPGTEVIVEENEIKKEAKDIGGEEKGEER